MLLFLFSLGYPVMAQLEVTTMPTYNGAEGNAVICQSIDIWGIAEGGTGPYNCQFFVDGVPQGASQVRDNDSLIKTPVTFNSPGKKLVRLVVVDAVGTTQYHESVLKVWPSNPPNVIKINMAIEKGMLYLLEQRNYASSSKVYWWGKSSSYTFASTASSILAMEEQGHFAYNSFSEDPYSRTLQRALRWLLSAYSGQLTIKNNPDGFHAAGICISDRFTGAGGPTAATSGTLKASYLFNQYESDMYANAFGLMAVIMSQPDSLSAASTIVDDGYFLGWRLSNVVKDALDMLYWCQGYCNVNPGSSSLRGGYCYDFVPVLPGYKRYDGSTMQWPSLVMKYASDRWKLFIPGWIKENMDYGYSYLTYTNNGVGYDGANVRPNVSKTAGKLTALSLVGNPLTAPTLAFLESEYLNCGLCDLVDAGWAGNFYAMYALKKGLQFQNIELLGTHNWYNDLAAWLTGETAGTLPSLSCSKTLAESYGQWPDGSWRDKCWINNDPTGGTSDKRAIGTAHAILILAKSLTSINPVANILDLSDHPPCDSVLLDASTSFHIDNNSTITDWDWNINNNPSYNDLHGKRPVIPKNLFYSPGSYSIKLRVKDDNNPPRINTTSVNLNITTGDHIPIAIPLSKPRISYNGRINETIHLDAGGSYDPDHTAIDTYYWYLGCHYDCTGSTDPVIDATTTSPFMTFSSAAKLNGLIGLKVKSNGLTSPIEYVPVIVSNDDLAITGISVQPATVCAQDSLSVSVTLLNDVSSSTPFSHVRVNFWNEDPRTTGRIISKNYFADLNQGIPVILNAKIRYTRDLEKVYAYVDADEKVDEFNENNNILAAVIPRITHNDFDTICQNSFKKLCLICNDDTLQYKVEINGLIQPAHGLASVIDYRSIKYTPVAGFHGQDTMRYIVKISNRQTGMLTCFDTAFVYLTIRYAPVPAFSHGIIPSCPYDRKISFTDLSTTPECSQPLISWQWNFGDPAAGTNNTSSVQNPTHSFTTFGTYNVVLMAENSYLCTLKDSMNITIPNSLPHADFSFPPLICVNDPISFLDNSTTPAGSNITKWEWNFGDATPSVLINAPASPNIVHVFRSNGPFKVQLIVTNSTGCIDTIQKNVQPLISPKADFTYNPDCYYTPLSFFNSTSANGGLSILSYSWDFGDGSPTVADPNPTHLFPGGNTYTVTLIATNTGNCNDTVSKPVIVYPKPGVDFTFQTGMQNFEMLFHNLTGPSVGNNLKWDFGDGIFGYGPDPSHLYQGPGNYLVSLIGTDGITSCSDTVRKLVQVPGIPIPFFTTLSPVICLSDTMYFIPHIHGGNIIREVWNYGDGPTDTGSAQ
ncbi:MAG: PKD domain-containing protein [Bacteroidota bacterium]